MAFLVKSERRDALKWVWLGVAAAIVMTVAVFLIIQFGENTISGLAAEAIAGIASLVAVAIVTTMVLWMKKAAASMSGELRSDMARALETGSLAVLALAFLAVGREGVETALFMVGYAEAQTAWPLIGLVIGVVVAAAIAYGMYAGAIRINLAKFFKYTGVFLIVVAAGILSYGIGALQTVGWLPGPGRQGIRHQHVVQLVVLVRRDHPGRLQHHAHPDRAAARRVAGLPRHRADDLPAPDEGSRETRSFTTTPPRTRKVNYVKLHSSLAIAAAALAGVALSSCQAKEEAAPAEPGKSAPAEITVTASDTACELSGTEGDDRPKHVRDHQQRQQGHRVLRLRRGRAGDGRGGEHLPRTAAQADRAARRAGHLPDRVQAGHGRRRHPRRFQGHRRRRARSTTAGKFKEASDSYKRYVNSQTDALIAATQVFVDAVKKGDVNAAKAQFPIARTYYERIEPVAESFPNDLDPRIDLREADLEPGQKWTGFHRLEKDLWVTGLQPDTNAMADQLMADVKELDAGVKAPDYKIDSTQIAGGAQGLLDEVASSKITGEEDIFSHTDLWDFKANVEGSQTAVASVRPILDERNAELGKRVDQRFAEVEALLEKYRQGDGFISYDKVTEPQRQELSRAIDALSKEVSQVQGVIAPQ